MDDPKKHAAHLRWLIEHCSDEDEAALLAGAAALEAQGAWRIGTLDGLPRETRMIPAEKWEEWEQWRKDREPGEPSAIEPTWAKPVPDDVMVTGWRA